MKYAKFSGLAMLLFALAVTGCGDKPAVTPPKGEVAKDKDKAKKKEDDHAHGNGPHGGAAFDFGAYHGEFMVDHAKQEATVYILGDDLKTAAPIQADKLTLGIKSPSFEVELKPMPLEGEPVGKSSRFVGKHEKLGVVQEFEGTVTGEVGGKPANGKFKEEPEVKK